MRVNNTTTGRTHSDADIEAVATTSPVHVDRQLNFTEHAAIAGFSPGMGDILVSCTTSGCSPNSA